MSRTGGRLQTVNIVHWENMLWFPRGITPTDMDGLEYSAVYWYEADNDFMFFEFKHDSAGIDRTSGQSRALRALTVRRLTERDRVMWVCHDATVGDDGIVHIVPESVTRWRAFVGGGPNVTRLAEDSGADSLEEYCRRWATSKEQR